MCALQQRRGVRALGGLALSCLTALPVSAETLHSLRLPAPASGLAEAAGIGGDRPTARIVEDVIRAIHPLSPGLNAVADARRARVIAWLQSPARVEADPAAAVVPSPLSGDCWRAALGLAGASEEQVVGQLLSRRDFALVYLGLMQAAPGLRDYLASRPELVATLAGQNAGVLAAFPRAVDVVDGRVEVPGGAPLVAFWESLAGASVADPSAFLLAVQTRADGRIAFMLDTLARLDEYRRLFAMSAAVDSIETRLEDLAALADAFSNTHREWRPAERPFWRVRMDPLVVLASLDVDADGRLVGPQPREFWDFVFGGQRSAAAPTSTVDGGGVVTAGWLVNRVISGGDFASQARLGAVRFTQRLYQRQEAAALHEVAASGRAFVEAPALMLVLERTGIASARTYAAAAAAGRTLTGALAAPEGEWALTTFQAAIALIDRAAARRSLDAATASRLVDELCAIEHLDRPQGRRVLSRWVGSRLVQTMAGRGAGSVAGGAADAEAIVLDALAGRRARQPDADAPTFELDGQPYRADLARAERDRLGSVRQRQRSVRLGTALRLVEQTDALAAAGAAEEFDRVRLALVETFASAMSPRGSRGGIAADEERLGDARTRLEAHGAARPGAGGDRQRAVQAVANAGADWAVADALRGLVYAVSLGEADGVVTLAPDIGRRHRFGTARIPGQAVMVWSLPEESRDDAQVWFVQGALLGLEHALGPLALRSVAQTAAAPARFIYELARRQLAMGVALANAFDLTSDQRDRLADAVRAGTRAVAAWCESHPRQIADLGDGLTASHVAWACANDRGSVPRLVTLDRLVDLGMGDPGPGVDPWGTVRGAAVNGLRPRWPRASNLFAVRGRVVDGLFLSTVVAPAIRVALVLAARGMPGTLAPAVLSLFVADLIREAPVSFEGDAFGFALGAADMEDDRFDEYLAALASGGPVVPAASTSEQR